MVAPNPGLSWEAAAQSATAAVRSICLQHVTRPSLCCVAEKRREARKGGLGRCDGSGGVTARGRGLRNRGQLRGRRGSAPSRQGERGAGPRGAACPALGRGNWGTPVRGGPWVDVARGPCECVKASSFTVAMASNKTK